MRRLIRCTCLALLCLPQFASAQSPTAGAITIGRIDSLWSPTLKEHRRVWIYTPPSYRDTLHAPQRYPVLYLLDGDAHFHSVTGLLQIFGTGVNGTYVVPEMIVVAILNTDRTRPHADAHGSGPALRSAHEPAGLQRAAVRSPARSARPFRAATRYDKGHCDPGVERASLSDKRQGAGRAR